MSIAGRCRWGVDATLAERADGAALVAGLTVHYGEAKGHTASLFGRGTIDTDARGLGATLSWYGPRGFYVDGQAQWNWFDSDLKSDTLGRLVSGNDGRGQAFSLEIGKRSIVGGGFTLTPQAQMVYAHVGFDRFTDPVGAEIADGKGASLKTRWGLSIDHQASRDAGGTARRSHVYGLLNLSYEWLDGTDVAVSGTRIGRRDDRLWSEIGLGGSYGWNDRVTIFGEVTGNTPLANFGDGYTLKANAGVRLRF